MSRSTNLTTMSAVSATDPIQPDVLARRTLTLAALEGEAPIAGNRFPPGATISVGSNSGNDLVIPEKFELTAYTLISRGSLLHLVPPFYVQATVWWGDDAVELKGYFRDLRKRMPDLPAMLPLAGERFIVRYASGISLIGRFTEAETHGGGQN